MYEYQVGHVLVAVCKILCVDLAQRFERRCTCAPPVCLRCVDNDIFASCRVHERGLSCHQSPQQQFGQAVWSVNVKYQQRQGTDFTGYSYNSKRSWNCTNNMRNARSVNNAEIYRFLSRHLAGHRVKKFVFCVSFNPLVLIGFIYYFFICSFHLRSSHCCPFPLFVV